MTQSPLTYVDLTSLFKSCVKTIRMKNKAMGVTLPQAKIFPTSSATSPLYTKARDIQTVITNHRNLLRDHRKKYITNSNEDPLSDLEKNNMEKVVATNIKIIEDKIKALESDVKKICGEVKCNSHTIECYQSLVKILRSNLHGINFTFRELKDLRQNRQKVKDKLSRLQRPVSSKRKSKTSDNTNGCKVTSHDMSLRQNEDDVDSSITLEDSRENKEIVVGDKARTNGEQNVNRDSSTSNNFRETNSSIASTNHYLEDEMSNLLEDISPEEKQLLEQENTHLYQELQSNQDEVRQITKQVVELGKMQDLLSENVEIQAHQIEEIQETIMASTENVQQGNEKVREAMRKDAGFRVWIMFFLIMMSFTLLFLDWYNF